MTRKLPLLARRKDGVNSAHAWPIHLRIDVEGDELQVLKATIIKVQERTDATSFDTPINSVAHSDKSVQLP